MPVILFIPELTLVCDLSNARLPVNCHFRGLPGFRCLDSGRLAGSEGSQVCCCDLLHVLEATVCSARRLAGSGGLPAKCIGATCLNPECSSVAPEISYLALLGCCSTCAFLPGFTRMLFDLRLGQSSNLLQPGIIPGMCRCVCTPGHGVCS